MKRHHSNWLFILVLLNLQVALSQSDIISVIAGGDVMLGSWAQETIRKLGYNYPWKNLQFLLNGSDIVFVNLEAPFGHSGEAVSGKSFTFRVDPQLVNTLKGGPITLVSLANNHMMDYGAEALAETRALLEKEKIGFAGAGNNQQEACRPRIIEVKNKKIGFFSYSLTFPDTFWATDSTAGTCFPSHKFIYRQIHDLRAKVDYLFVSCHWGQELMEKPKKYQVELAHKLIDAGVDLVIGHHPHVIQGLEIYKGRLIAYSLGNFVFGSYSEHVKESMLIKVDFIGEQKAAFRVFPISVYNREVEFAPRLLTGTKKAEFLGHLEALSRELNQTSLVISSDGRVTYETNQYIIMN